MRLFRWRKEIFHISVFWRKILWAKQKGTTKPIYPAKGLVSNFFDRLLSFYLKKMRFLVLTIIAKKQLIESKKKSQMVIFNPKVGLIFRIKNCKVIFKANIETNILVERCLRKIEKLWEMLELFLNSLEPFFHNKKNGERLDYFSIRSGFFNTISSEPNQYHK